ncbi:MAG: hypothetical protein IPM54_42720 [Polyangiaceae bacterium]|nr:hypothetical protein [Polyangiaceae bacterium]
MSTSSETPSLDELRNEVSRLERLVVRFEERIALVRWQFTMLDRAKASHSRFLDWEWEHRNIRTEAQSRRLAHVLGELNARVLGNWRPDPDSNNPIPDVASDTLYSPSAPTVAEVYDIVKAVAGFSTNAKVVEMFHVLQAKGSYPALTALVLAAVDR